MVGVLGCVTVAPRDGSVGPKNCTQSGCTRWWRRLRVLRRTSTVASAARSETQHPHGSGTPGALMGGGFRAHWHRRGWGRAATHLREMTSAPDPLCPPVEGLRAPDCRVMGRRRQALLRGRAACTAGLVKIAALMTGSCLDALRELAIGSSCSWTSGLTFRDPHRCGTGPHHNVAAAASHTDARWTGRVQPAAAVELGWTPHRDGCCTHRPVLHSAALAEALPAVRPGISQTTGSDLHRRWSRF